MRRCAAALLLVLLLAAWFPVTVSANSPPPSPWYTFVVSNLPEGTVYVDLLIRLQETDANYVELEENLPGIFSEDADIITYCEDGFRSYTFHYRGARSVILPDQNNCVTFFADSAMIYEFVSTGHQEDIERRGKIRLAMLDENGNILQVSKPQSLRPKGLLATSTGIFRYDASADKLTVDSYSYFWRILLFLLISAAGIFMTCVIEGFVALFFEWIRNYTKLIRITNIISQLAMRLGQILLLWILPVRNLAVSYFWMVLLLEIPVYVCEFLVYKKHIWEASWQRCLVYTVCANTASALFGLLLLSFIF